MVAVPPDATPDHPAIREAAERIRAGGLVAFPTETVYGLGANALSEQAVRRIFEAKGRPATNPVIAHVLDAAGASLLVAEWPRKAAMLAHRWWPGPLTMVLPRSGAVPDALTAGQPAVAVRSPANGIARALIAAAGVPIAAPSANRSTTLSPTTARHVAAGLGEAAEFILDGGPTSVGIESTVVDLTRTPPVLLRPGAVSRAALEEFLGPLGSPEVGEAARSPGMMALHYAPRAALRVVAGAELAVEVARERAAGRRVGVLAHAEVQGAHQQVVLPREPAAFATGLYAALHALDAAGVEVILVEAVPAEPAWEGVADRLRRAVH